jgi:hypothetical protein
VTKKDAAVDLLAVAKSIHDGDAPEEDARFWIQWLLGTARALHPMIHEHPWYTKLLLSDGGDSRAVKLRRLIEHPATSAHEREAAVAALARVRSE